MPFDEYYFSTHTYKDVSCARYSQYWWSNRFYAILARRYGKRGTRLLEIGSGLGHLVGQLVNRFQTYAVDVNLWALKQSLQASPQGSARGVAACTWHVLSSAEELPFANETFGMVIIKHVVEHLPNAGKAIAEIGRIVAPEGVLILATPNLDSLLKPLKGEKWIGYLDPTHISLKPPAEWLGMIESAGFWPVRIFADGFWDSPYIPLVPKMLQKFCFGSFGGLQAMTGFIFLPLKWGESMIIVARRI